MRHWRQIPSQELQVIVSKHDENYPTLIELSRTARSADAQIERLTAERDAQYDLNVSMIAKHAAEIEEMREVLKRAKDLATWWINRECTANCNQQEYNSWLALGHHSSTMEAIRAVLDKGNDC